MLDSEKTICYKCIGDLILRKEISKSEKKTQCHYCKKTNKSITLDQLANRVDETFRSVFTQANQERLTNSFLSDFLDQDENPEDFRSLVEERIGIERESLLEDLCKYLLLEKYDGRSPREHGFEEAFYNEEANYIEYIPEKNIYQEKWDQFCASLKKENRFINKKAITILDDIFKNLPKLRTKTGDAVIQDFGTNSIDDGYNYKYVFRGRVANSLEAVKIILAAPVKELSSPPSEKAKTGRMNACGISVFYGTGNTNTCIAELRAPVGSYVVIGKFERIKSVKICNFEFLADVFSEESCFDKNYKDKQDRKVFLKKLMKELTSPAIPGNEEFDYLPTQFISEYLESKYSIDGIAFNSTQDINKGENIVFFHKSSRVESYLGPEIVKVCEGLLGEVLFITEKKGDIPVESDIEKDDPRKIFLKLTPEIDVLKIQGVAYKSREIPIVRIPPDDQLEF